MMKMKAISCKAEHLKVNICGSLFRQDQGDPTSMHVNMIDDEPTVRIFRY